MADTLISTFRLYNNVLKDIVPFSMEYVKDKTFYVQRDSNPKFEEPNLVIQESTVQIDIETPNIILISAAGATGKTELVNYISYKKNIPIINLTEHPAVGANSLTGLLVDKLKPAGFASFINSMQKGEQSLLIDALDEANLKVNNNGFFSFLDDVYQWAKASASIIMFGRTEVMGFTYEYFKEKNAKVSSLQIAPFTKDQAKSFINKQVDKNETLAPYKQLRDYIIDSIEGFFENNGDITKKQKELFLGYAPVLLAISKLLSTNNNYQKLFNEMQTSKKKNVDLLLSVIDYILVREQENKVKVNLLPQLLFGRTTDFCKIAEENCYCKLEQCYRCFCRITKQPEKFSPTGDTSFDNAYNKKMQEANWSSEHPFLVDGHQIQNIVFESYLLIVLVQTPKYEQMIIDYLKRSHQNSYMFFFLYERMAQSEMVNPCLIPFLYDSLKTIDKKDFTSSLYVGELSTIEKKAKADVYFAIGNDGEQEVTYKTLFDEHFVLEPRQNFSNVILNVPINIELSSSKTQLTAPLDITCKRIKITCDSLTFNCINKENDYTAINCEGIDIDYQNCPNLDLRILNYEEKHMNFASSEKLPYPFSEYQNAQLYSKNMSEDILEKYKKLRAMIAMFRKHSRTQMGKLKEKIDNRIGATPEGQSIISAFLDENIMKVDKYLYLIDDDIMSEKLGLTYASLRTFEFNKKTTAFLKRCK